MTHKKTIYAAIPGMATLLFISLGCQKETTPVAIAKLPTPAATVSGATANPDLEKRIKMIETNRMIPKAIKEKKIGELRNGQIKMESH